jgi:hypothetical protein
LVNLLALSPLAANSISLSSQNGCSLRFPFVFLLDFSSLSRH